MDSIFPFNSVDNRELNNIFRHNTGVYTLSELDSFHINPLDCQYDKYDEYDVNNFFGKIRNLDIPVSEYITTPIYLPFCQ